MLYESIYICKNVDVKFAILAEASANMFGLTEDIGDIMVRAKTTEIVSKKGNTVVIVDCINIIGRSE